MAGDRLRAVFVDVAGRRHQIQARHTTSSSCHHHHQQPRPRARGVQAGAAEERRRRPGRRRVRRNYTLAASCTAAGRPATVRRLMDTLRRRSFIHPYIHTHIQQLLLIIFVQQTAKLQMCKKVVVYSRLLPGAASW